MEVVDFLSMYYQRKLNVKCEGGVCVAWLISRTDLRFAIVVASIVIGHKCCIKDWKVVRHEPKIKIVDR